MRFPWSRAASPRTEVLTSPKDTPATLRPGSPRTEDPMAKKPPKVFMTCPKCDHRLNVVKDRGKLYLYCAFCDRRYSTNRLKWPKKS